MPKIKTRKSVAKRFKLTGSGKVSHKKSFARHKLTAKNSHRRRSLRSEGYIAPTEAKTIKKLMPYL